MAADTRRADVPSKINGVDTRPTAPVGAGRATQRTQDPVTGGSGQEVSAKQSKDVQFSGAANQLAALEQSLLEMPEVDEAKVEDIRMQIETGVYRVKPEVIADGLIQFENVLSKLEK
jgi:negative regulator of flagellin synthesis FlgM